MDFVSPWQGHSFSFLDRELWSGDIKHEVCWMKKSQVCFHIMYFLCTVHFMKATYPLKTVLPSADDNTGGSDTNSCLLFQTSVLFNNCLLFQTSVLFMSSVASWCFLCLATSFPPLPFLVPYSFFWCTLFNGQVNQCQHQTHAHYKITESALWNHPMDLNWRKIFLLLYFFFA